MKCLIFLVATIWFSLAFVLDVNAQQNRTQRKPVSKPKQTTAPQRKDIPARKTVLSDPVSGEWSGTLDLSGQKTPFKLNLKLDAGKVAGEFHLFVAGPLKVTQGSLTDNKLELTLGSLRMVGSLSDGKFIGELGETGKESTNPAAKFEAQRQSQQLQPAQQAQVKEYKQGEVYQLGDIVNLNAEGNKLVVEMAQANQGAESKESLVFLKIKISGKPTSWSYKLGGEWDFILAADQKRIAPSKAAQSGEVISEYAEPTLTSNFTVVAKDGGIVYFRDTTRPLLLRFVVPEELAEAPKKLEVKSMLIGGGKDYSLIFNLNK